MALTLRVSEIFYSIQGESVYVGWPTVFIRLTGCPLRCRYCDTAYAFHGGTVFTLQEIMNQVTAYKSGYITLTGGEPLAQKNSMVLLRLLCDEGNRVSIETGGMLPIDAIDPRVMRVMDLKTPGSGETHRNRYENIAHLRPQDQLKFIICDREDYLWAVEKMKHYQLSQKCTVLFSPDETRQAVAELADWMLADRLHARLQVQLHKYLWGNVPGR